jgi:hypothetical protein
MIAEYRRSSWRNNFVRDVARLAFDCYPFTFLKETPKSGAALFRSFHDSIGGRQPLGPDATNRLTLHEA